MSGAEGNCVRPAVLYVLMRDMEDIMDRELRSWEFQAVCSGAKAGNDHGRAKPIGAMNFLVPPMFRLIHVVASNTGLPTGSFDGLW